MEDRKNITIEDDAYDIIVNSPTEVYGSLSDAYASMKSNQDVMRNMGLSMSRSLQQLYGSMKPITPEFSKTAIASMTAGLSKVAEASKAATAQFNYAGTASAFSKLGQSIAKSNAIAETIKNSSTLAMTESMRKSMEASSRALSARFEMKGLSVPAEQIRTVVAANRALPKSIPALPTTAVTSLQSSLAAAIPKPPSYFDSLKSGLELFAGAARKIADLVSPFVKAAAGALSRFKDYLQKNVHPLLEKLRSIKPWPFLKRHAHKALLYLRRRWLSRRSKPLPLDEESFRKTIALQPIGPAASFEYFEFADRIRHINLRCHQRISEDTDDLNDSFLLAS